MNNGINECLKRHPLELLARYNKYTEEQKQIKENYKDENVSSSGSNYLFGLSLGIFLFVLVIMFIPFIAAIYLLIKYADKLSTWVKVVGWILTLLVPFGSLVTIGLVFSFKNK